MISPVRNIIIAITFIWIGMVLGISFLEAPLKFQAPNITLPLGLGIGRIVFAALNKVEVVFSLATLGLLFIKKMELKSILIYTPAILIVLSQIVWLIPILDKRAEIIISGKAVEDTYHHILYIILEVLKVTFLFWGGFHLFRKANS